MKFRDFPDSKCSVNFRHNLDLMKGVVSVYMKRNHVLPQGDCMSKKTHAPLFHKRSVRFLEQSRKKLIANLREKFFA